MQLTILSELLATIELRQSLRLWVCDYSLDLVIVSIWLLGLPWKRNSSLNGLSIRLRVRQVIGEVTRLI